MKWLVYWECDGECEFKWLPTESEARKFATELIQENMESWDEGHAPNWDVTVARVCAQAEVIPFDGRLRLKEVTG